MPLDLSSLERGFGEADVDWNGHTIVVRYRVNLNNRAMIALKRVMLGVLALDGVTRFPDVEAIILECERILLPSGPEIPDGERGWDLTRDGVPVAVTADELADLPTGLLLAILGAIMRDVNDPNRRRPSVAGSLLGAVSAPIASPTSTDSSRTLNGRTSSPGDSPGTTTPAASGSAGATGYDPSA